MMKKQLREERFWSFGFLVFALVLGLTAVSCETASAIDQSPGNSGGNIYFLQVPGFFSGYFSEAYSIASETGGIDNRESGQTGRVLLNKIPGKVKISEVTLRRAITSTMDLAKWRKMVTSGKINDARKDGVIKLIDSSSKEVARWNLSKTWPCKYICNPIEEAPKTGNPAPPPIEVVTLTAEGIERVK